MPFTPGGASPAPNVLPTWVPDPGKFWNLTQTNKISDIDPCPARNCSYSMNEGQSAVINDWNSGWYLPDIGPYGAVLLCGGGHDGYAGFEMYVGPVNASAVGAITYSMYGGPDADVAWTSNSNAVWGVGNTTGATIPNGTPAPPHTYDMGRVISGADWGNTKGAIVFVSIEPMFNTIDGFSRQCDRAWAFDFDTEIWSMSTVQPRSLAYAGTVYDPIRKCIYCMTPNGANTTIAKLSIPAMTWSTVAYTGDFLLCEQIVVGGWCEKWNVAIFNSADASFPNLRYIFDPATNVVAQMTVSGTLPTSVIGMEWCPHPNVQKFYCFAIDQGNTIVTLTPPVSNPLGGAWVVGSEAFTPQDGVQGAITQQSTNPRYNFLRWAPKLNSLICVAGLNQNPSAAVFRPAGAT